MKEKEKQIKASNIKGALLEYIVRELFKSCGFTNIEADGVYVYENKGLFCVNGRGAAHDADVIMTPPIQMPFAYPTQIIFECKAYNDEKNVVGLPIVRNVLGFRNDINEFEIVTKDSLKARKSNKKSEYAIETRRRNFYQIGIASVNDFTKPAIEFAINNKIPLLSLNWILGKYSIRDFNQIDDTYIKKYNSAEVSNLYTFLKDREGNLEDVKNKNVKDFLAINDNNLIGNIITDVYKRIKLFYVGFLNTGEVVFLYPKTGNSNVLEQGSQYEFSNAKFTDSNNGYWTLTIDDDANTQNENKFDCYFPKHWNTLKINEYVDLFSRIYIFNKKSTGMPFSVINLKK